MAEGPSDHPEAAMRTVGMHHPRAPLRSAPPRRSPPAPGTPRSGAGFTAIEMMIVVAIVGILAMIALPSYLAYIQRGKVSEVTSVLGGGRVLAEQYYNDNLTYVGSPCPASTKFFTIACATAATTYTFTATGTGDMSSFVYTINESNLRTTAGPWGSGNCWIFRQGDSC
jgi:type IV pilus assembly protein PilE